MNRFLASALLSIALLTATDSASAKEPTAMIEVSGGALVTPVEITDNEIVSRFNIWTGPGVWINGKQTHRDPERQPGMFIDWSRDKADQRPAQLQHYAVTFHLGSPRSGRRYIVSYEFDPATAGGYIYLPGRSDELGPSNTRWIYHGVEGNWFYSSTAWENLVRPLIEAATSR